MGERSIRLASRNIDAVLEALALPIMLMLVFVYLFGGAIKVGGRYVDYVVPGVLLLCVVFGSSMTAVSVSHDMNGGIIDRFRSMNVSAALLLFGHVIASLARNAVSILLAFGVGVGVGMRPAVDLPRWVAAFGVLLLFALALSWLSAVVGVLTRSPEAATGFTFFAFFLVNPSSALVPVATMPHWVRGFAQNQPVTAVADAVRSLLLGGGTAGAATTRSVVWCLCILGLSVTAAAPVVRRRTA